MVVKITLNDKNNPPGKLADAEIHFTDGVLDGLEADRLRHLGAPHRRRSQRHVPGAPVLGERRAPQLLAAAARHRDATAQDRLRELILQAYAEYEERAAVTT